MEQPNLIEIRKKLLDDNSTAVLLAVQVSKRQILLPLNSAHNPILIKKSNQYIQWYTMCLCCQSTTKQ